MESMVGKQFTQGVSKWQNWDSQQVLILNLMLFKISLYEALKTG